MKKLISHELEIPEGITCTLNDKVLVCKKDQLEISRVLDIPQTEIKIQENKIKFTCKKGNKNTHKTISTFQAHIQNMFNGLQKEFVYHLESANVHFPMSLKLEEDRLVINNFLGEKVPRYARILPNVKIEIKGQSITLTSHDKEAAGQTAANLEKATKLKGRDRRIFQDGIFITKKPGRKM